MAGMLWLSSPFENNNKNRDFPIRDDILNDGMEY